MYAVIATGGKQYKVSEGDIINVEKLAAQAGETVTFDDVIAVNDGTMKAGADVSGSTVTASVVKEGRAKKVIVYRYKRKTGYHKKKHISNRLFDCQVFENDNFCLLEKRIVMLQFLVLLCLLN